MNQSQTKEAQLNHATPEMIYKTCTHSDKRYIFHYFADRFRPPLTDCGCCA